MNVPAPTGAGICGSLRERKQMINRQGLGRMWMIGGVAVVTATAGLVVGVAGPAAADPITTLVGVGSDTTQDVMDQIAINVGGGLVGSWDAVNPSTNTAGDLISPKSGCTMTRPNGSGQGLNALRKSINTGTGATQLANPPEAGCVDFARSSSGPSAADANANGQLVYVPFALDAVATATGPATAANGALATNIKDADLFTKTDLQTMYQTCTAVTPAGSTVSYVPDGAVTDATHQPIHLYIPQAGSGTRSFWIGQMGLPTTGALPNCVHDTIVGTSPAQIVQEHDGTVFATDADGLGPFSIAQWVAQRNGHNDRRHEAVLHNLNGVQPLTGTSPGTGSLNASYPIKREVYNIVSYSRVTSSATADKPFVSLFSGATSGICRQTGTLLNFGFGTLATAPLGHTCGQVATDLRAFDAANPL